VEVGGRASLPDSSRAAESPELVEGRKPPVAPRLRIRPGAAERFPADIVAKARLNGPEGQPEIEPGGVSPR